MIKSLLSCLLILFIRAYQTLLSPFWGKKCRFHPSCSAYAEIAIKKYGPWKGSIMAMYRILRCNPLNKKWGEDHP